MKISKLKKRIFLMALVTILAFPTLINAEQLTDTGSGTLTGNPDAFVDVVVSDNTISYGTLNISAQGLANARTDGGTEYVIFESQTDITNDSIAFDEGATNSNSFYKVTSSGETYPLVGGLNNTNWIFLKDATSGTAYVKPQITGNLTNGGGGVTMPSGVNEVGSLSSELIYYTSADAGVTWSRNTKTVYIALGDDGRLYVDDAAALTASSQYITAKGGQTDDAFLGNNMVLSSTFPTLATDPVTLDFGYYSAWDATQGNGDKSFYALVDMPKHAATGHNWTWNFTITGEYHSNP
ncbi:MAG TPA: hypothetical protein VIO64_09975 [Pseudobacteroides sp.]|uniref:hypothetical protein n=1 Tax=Pseudobacteroides sp. TaxID=1968840 RepID=UPI002F92C302